LTCCIVSLAQNGSKCDRTNTTDSNVAAKEARPATTVVAYVNFEPVPPSEAARVVNDIKANKKDLLVLPVKLSGARLNGNTELGHDCATENAHNQPVGQEPATNVC
jgi:hypothetical protein